MGLVNCDYICGMFTISFSHLPPDVLAAQAKEKLQFSALADWERDVWTFVKNWYDKSILEVNVNTSGSTGTPKAIRIEKTKMLQSAFHTINALKLTNKDKACLCLPAAKIGGMMMIVRAIALGVDLVCIPPTANPWDVLSQLKGITFLACTPMQMAASFEQSSALSTAQKIKTILLGGGPITAWMKPHLTRFPNRVYHTFGMTETISHIALKKVSGTSPDKHFTTVGDIILSVDDRQCLCISSSSLNFDHIITNDIVRLISATTFEWLGRFDHVINSGGLKIYPEEIEAQLHHYLPFDFFVFGLPDALLGEKVCIAVPLLTIENELRKALAFLPKNSQPKAIYFLKKIVYTTTGKIDRVSSLRFVATIH